MKITNIQINHMVKPLGYDLSGLRIEFSVEDTTAKALTKKLIIWTDDENHPVYETENEKFDNNYFAVPLNLLPRMQYFVKVIVSSEKENAEAESSFETGKMTEKYSAKWIANKNKDIQNTLFKKEFSVSKTIKQARLYITGLGLYESYLNDKRSEMNF